MTFQELLKDYWSQLFALITAVGGTIGFIVAKITDVRSKKIEINHSLWQTGKLQAMLAYNAEYSKMHSYWTQMIYGGLKSGKTGHEIFANHTTAEMRDIVKMSGELCVYLDEDGRRIISEITSSFQKMTDDTITIVYRQDITPLQKSDLVSKRISEMRRVANPLMIELTKKIRRSFT